MSSLKQRQKFLELKFMGNRRLAEEFAYLQDPNVRKLEKWQKWKQQAEDEDRWVSWQRGERSARDRERQEKYRDPLLPRRKKRRYRRIKEKPQYDVQREIARVEKREQSAWRRELEVVEAINTPLRPLKDHVPVPPKPPDLMAFVSASERAKPRHWMEPSDWVPYPPELEGTASARASGTVRVVEVKKKKKMHAATRPPTTHEQPLPPPAAIPPSTPLPSSSSSRGSRPSSSSTSRGPSRSGESDQQRDERAVSVPGNYDVVYRFKLWWFGYVSATTIQRCVRGMLARLWLSFLIAEPRALKRRLACYAIQRLWRGHKGRQYTFALWVKKTSAAMFIQRFMRHLSHIRDVSVGKRREAACVKLQHSWYQLNSVLLSARVRAMVQNRREATSRRKGEQGLYWGALRMQIMMVRYLARIRFRKRKKVEHAAATKVQALMRGAWGRKHAQVSKVEKALAEKAAGKKFNWALARLCSDFLARLRTKKATLVKHRSVMIIQRVFRGSIARNLNKRLKEQSSLVRNWLTDFKHERVPGLIDSKEVNSFYSMVDPHRKVPPRVEKHAKTSVEDLPKALRIGPLFHDLNHVHHHHDSGSGSHHHRQQHHHHQPQLRVGVEIGPTSKEHIAIYHQAPQASFASSLGPQDLDDQVGAFDQTLDLRLRTVSRGLPASVGLVPHWDTSIEQPFDDRAYEDGDYDGEALEAAYAEQAARTRPGRVRKRTPDNKHLVSGGRGAAQTGDEAEASPPVKTFEFVEPPRHGFGAHHEVIDKGASRFQGDGNVKALDARSRALVHAPDRGAWAGVAPRPNNARKPRDPGSRLVMRDALDMIAQENRDRGYI